MLNFGRLRGQNMKLADCHIEDKGECGFQSISHLKTPRKEQEAPMFVYEWDKRSLYVTRQALSRPSYFAYSHKNHSSCCRNFRYGTKMAAMATRVSVMAVRSLTWPRELLLWL